MEDSEKKPAYLNASQVIFLPLWARWAVIGILGTLALSATVCGVVFLFAKEWRDTVLPTLSIAQTAAGGFAIVLFVLFAEKQLSTHRLMEKTDHFLDKHLVDSLSRIEIPSVQKDKTVSVQQIARETGVYGRRKDIYGANYEICLAEFKMRMWVGINVRRISTIYFVQAQGPEDVDKVADIFKFTFGGAEKVGYHTHFEYSEIHGEKIISMWSTVQAEQGILGNPAEQLFWVQDIAMMTQSVARTAWRNQLSLLTNVEPGPL
jgi:hypothetical protein